MSSPDAYTSGNSRIRQPARPAPDSQPTWNRPKRAAQYYNVMRSECRGCRIVAAEAALEIVAIEYAESVKGGRVVAEAEYYQPTSLGAESALMAERLDVRLHTHAGVEFIYTLKGRLIVHIDGQEVTELSSFRFFCKDGWGFIAKASTDARLNDTNTLNGQAQHRRELAAHGLDRDPVEIEGRLHDRGARGRRAHSQSVVQRRDDGAARVGRDGFVVEPPDRFERCCRPCASCAGRTSSTSPPT